MDRTDLLKQASAMAYVTLLSIIPSLAAILSIITIFKPLLSPDTDLIGMIRDFLLTHLAKGSGEVAFETIDNLMKGLNFAQIGVSSFVGLLFSLILLLRQIENALNKIWHVDKGRNIFTRFVYFWTFLTLGTFLASLALGYLSKIGFTAALNLEGTKTVLNYVLEKVYTYFSGYIIFLFLLKTVPNTHVPFKFASIGALTSTFLLDQAGSAFTWYVASFSSHKAVYGALAALPLFLMWLYICWVIILFGALICWRSSQGFKEAENDHLLLHPKSEDDFYLSRKVESLSPILCMLEITNFFWHSSPQSITTTHLEKKLDLPISWILKSVDFLESKGLIKINSSSSESTSFMPAVPIEKFELKSLYDLFELDAHSQLVRAKEVISDEGLHLVKQFIDKVESNPTMKLVDFLDRDPKKV